MPQVPDDLDAALMTAARCPKCKKIAGVTSTDRLVFGRKIRTYWCEYCGVEWR